MGKYIASWTKVRELESSSRSEISYVRNALIERVSLVENESDNNFSIRVHTMSNSYLYDSYESDKVGLQALSNLVEAL